MVNLPQSFATSTKSPKNLNAKTTFNITELSRRHKLTTHENKNLKKGA